ncbi:MAG TPA: ATP-binding protein [Puia sp.]|uniref:ATP-binding protein n=1 Tax=Puia sp. TaxID=2045100 RepID=UPI002CF49301|nr:ATP-binding protein [Puia sp.]HVU97731.1 ATP-binding protein [Puia sp.]
MNPTLLSGYLAKAIPRNYPVLLAGKPGIGKTDIITAAAEAAGAELIISHPVVSDPTDFKGLPFPTGDGRAEFLPYGDLERLAKAEHKTVFFLDDLGQASISVQAACMQLILARQINGHRVSNNVEFLAATNRKIDRAGVSAFLEPLKSRFFSILKLDVSAKDWVKWAETHEMPPELIAYIQFNPAALEDAKPNADLENSVSPRTLAHLGRQQTDGLDPEEEAEVFAGAVGEAFAIEYRNFLALCRQMPRLDAIIADPGRAMVHPNASVMYAISGGLARIMNDANIGPICTYLDRVEPELSVACMINATNRNPQLKNNREYAVWVGQHHKAII